MYPRSERLLQERTRALEAANTALQQREQGLAAELDASQRLQQVATQLITARGAEALFENILDALVAIMHSDFASLQMFCPERGPDGELRLLGHRGFSAQAAKRWAWVSRSRHTTCGEVLRSGRRVVVSDVRRCNFMAGSEDLDGYLEGGLCAGQSTPLLSRSSELLGVASTYWSEPHELSATELRTLDILARLAADLIERSRVEEELREHNERLRALFNHQLVAINITSPDKHWVEANDTWCKMIGYSREELAHTDWASLTHPEDLPTDLKQFERLIAGEIDQYRLEKRFIRKDGSILECEISVSCARNPDGSVRQVIGLGTDIGERRRAEKQLRDSERRFRSLFDNAFDAIFIAKTDGSVQMANSMACSILGMTEQEICSAGRSGIVVDDKRLGEALETRRLTGKVRAELTFVRKDGSKREGEISSTAWGDSGQTFVIMRDITERKQAEAALRESERRLKNSERIAHLGHWQWDLQSNRVSGSEEMYRIFGKPPDYVPSYRGFLDDLEPPDRERIEELVKDSLARKVGHSIEYQIAGAGGERKTISCIWEVLVDEEGAPVRLFGTCQDITECRRAQEESFSRQKLESIGTLASGIAHDFNNLLGGVLSQAELALDELPAESTAEEELKGIRDVALRGSEIVRELMIYAGKDSRLRELVDVAQIVKEMVELLKLSASKHATLETDLGQNLPAVWANAAQIRQIVMNLVMNASEATAQRHGLIRVTTRFVKMDLDSSRAISDRLASGDYLQLEVSDTGCGIPLEMQTRIFDPFFSTKSGGRGLGLAVVHGIVKDLGGAINLVSEPGHGTTFQILLPCAEIPSGAIHRPKSDTRRPARQSHAYVVLIVEDEDALRQAVSKMLSRQDFSVIEAADGSAALDLMRGHNHAIDVLFLDITLPGASSREVLEEAQRLRPEMKVIVTSAYPEQMAGALLQSPIERFLRKPYRVHDLVQLIDAIKS